MSKTIKLRYKKEYKPVFFDIPERVKRRKIPITTLAAAFKLYNEKQQVINIMYSAFEPSPEKFEMQKNALEGLLKRLETFNIDHRFDVAGARNELAKQQLRT